MDWLNMVGPTHDRAWAVGRVAPWFGPGEGEAKGYHGYQRCHAWSDGAKLFFSEEREDCCLSMNGDAVDLIPVAEQLQLLVDFYARGWHASKIDLAADCGRGLLSMDEVHAAGDAGNMIGFRLYDPMRPKRRERGRMVPTGDQANFGRKGKDGSGIAYSIYDKGLESKGEVDGIRIEMKAAKQRASILGEVLASSADVATFARKISTAIGGNIDFRERGQEKNRDRMPRLAWWQAVLVELGNAPKIHIERQAPRLEQTVGHCVHQYGNALAGQLAVCESRGEDFVGLLMRELRRRLDELDWDKWGKRDLDSSLAAALRG